MRLDSLATGSEMSVRACVRALVRLFDPGLWPKPKNRSFRFADFPHRLTTSLGVLQKHEVNTAMTWLYGSNRQGSHVVTRLGLWVPLVFHSGPVEGHFFPSCPRDHVTNTVRHASNEPPASNNDNRR